MTNATREAARPRIAKQTGGNKSDGPDALKLADEKHGYKFGIEGLMPIKDAAEFLGISRDTIDNRCEEGFLRKGKHPDGADNTKVFICRRSLREYVATMEQ